MPQQAQIDAVQELWRRYQVDPSIFNETQVAGLTELRKRWGLAELEVSPLPSITQPQFEPAVAATTAQRVVIPEPPAPPPPPEPRPMPEIRPLGMFEAWRSGLKIIGKDTPVDRFSDKVAEFVAGDPESDLEPGAFAPGGPLTAQIRKTLRIAASLPWTFTIGFLNDMIKDPGGTALGIQDAVVKGIKNFAILQNPLGTEKQREKVYNDLVEDPTQFGLVALVVHGFAKPLTAKNMARKAVRETLAEVPRVAEKPPVRPVEVVKPEIRPEVPVEPIKPVEGKIIGLNVAESTRIRSELGLDKLDPPSRRTWETTLSEAKIGKKDYTALETADELLKNNRPITDTEHAGMVLKANDLANQYDGVIREVNAFIERGDIGKAEIARIRAEGIIDNIDKLTEATRFGRRETARSLSIGRMMISRETYQLAHVMQRARASKGSRLSPKETAKIEKIVAEHSVLQDQLKQAEVAYERLLAEHDRMMAENVTRIETRKTRPKKVTAIESILAERANIKAQLTEMGYRVNDITGVTAEGAYLVGKLAVNYVKEGVSTLPDLVRRIREDVPVLTERDVYQSIIAKDPKRQVKARSETTKLIADLKTQADLLLKIEKAEKGVFDLPKGKTPRIAEVRVLQTNLRELRSQAYKTGMHPARIERALKTINELQDQLANYYRPIRQRRAIEIQELASAKEKINDLRREMRVEDDLARLNEQMRTGDFVIKEKLPKKAVSPELERSQIELKRVRRQIRIAIDDMAPLTPRKLSVEAINTLRTLKATADFSYTFRQALVLSVRRPIKATKAFGKATKSFFNKYTAERVDNALRSAEHHYIREKSGLQLTEVDAVLTRREEMFGARMIEKVPIIGDVVTASNRHMVTGLNILRSSAFDEFLVKFPNATHAELVAWADWINVAGGRGNLGRAASVANTLSLFLFAPRFAASRIQTPYMMFKYWKMPRVRKAIAKDVVAVTSLGAMTLALADLAGFEVGLDPRNPDFGKIRIGDTRIDIWGGLQQPIRLTARVGLSVTDKIGITGKELAERDKAVDPIELVSRFSIYKLAPAITIPSELVRGETIVGEPVSPAQTAARAVLPLWLDDVADAYRHENAGKAVLVGSLTFMGVGATTYEDSETQTRRRIRQMMMDNNYIGADQLKLEWNMKNPDNPIRKVSIK